jgi:hypothetical protein
LTTIPLPIDLVFPSMILGSTAPIHRRFAVVSFFVNLGCKCFHLKALCVKRIRQASEQSVRDCGFGLNYLRRLRRLLLRRHPQSGQACSVFHRSSITKRVIAFCGVWLTFVSCMQQTHAFCELYGCSNSEKQQVLGDCCETNAGDEKCPHKQRCNSGRTQSVESTKVAVDHQPTVPCEDGCWCRQAPSPQQAPVPLDAESLTQPLVMYSGAMLVATSLNAPQAGWAATIYESSPERAIDVCVRLCRFLA